MSWTEDCMRILHLDTISTMNHPFPAVHAGKKQAVKTTAAELLKPGRSCRTARASQTQISSVEAQDLREDVEAMEGFLDGWNQDRDPSCNEWDFAMTSIVARKALVIEEHQEWMVAKQ